MQKGVETEPDRIETKKLMLVGLERYMNVEEGFVDRLGELKQDLISRLHEVEGKARAERFVGFWQMILGARECDRMYLAAAEVDCVKNLPDAMVAKAFPKSEYTIWYLKNGEEGSVSPFAWLPRSAYEWNTAIIGDFEAFWLDPAIDTHEFWVPIVPRRECQDEEEDA